MTRSVFGPPRIAAAVAFIALAVVVAGLTPAFERRSADSRVFVHDFRPSLNLSTLSRGLARHWQRVFVDDFTRDLNLSTWGRYSGQPRGDPGGWWAPSHVVVKHGILHLETYRDARHGGRWVSGGLSSSRALKQTYGKYEVRFRMQQGTGVAGILLLWPVRDVWPPEIDFAENAGETSARPSMTASFHYGEDNRQIQRTVHADFTRWHTIGVEWTPGRLVYTLDGRRWAVVRSPHVPDQPMELDLQTQAGTCGDRYAPCPDSSTPSRVTLQVDRVVAYAYRPVRNSGPQP
jgi:beta-glucanase (GH16 family)